MRTIVGCWRVEGDVWGFMKREMNIRFWKTLTTMMSSKTQRKRGRSLLFTIACSHSWKVETRLVWIHILKSGGEGFERLGC